ncbi:MAG: hypothetical protein ACXV5H_10615 [Halobacteriota archaeon]
MAIPTDADCFYALTVSCGSETNALRGKLAVRALNATNKSPEIINVVEGAGGASPISRSAAMRMRTCLVT